MKNFLRCSVLLCLILLLTTVFSTTAAQGNPPPPGVEVTCDDGTTFNNGVEFVVNQMRPGFTYTATAIGINGFDPVLAVLDEDGNGLCADDSVEALDFDANLPTTGNLAASSFTSQIQFSQTAGQMADVSLVVGGFGNQVGEFLLVLEGMAATSADGAGDPFSVQLSPSLIDGGVPLSVYMLAVTDVFDPLLYLADENFNVAQDSGGASIRCDDAGDANLCWGDSFGLAGSYVSRRSNTDVPGGNLDAMLQVPLEEYRDLDFREGPWYLTFVMTSFEQQTFGDYVIAFHAGTGVRDQLGQGDTPPPPPPTREPAPDDDDDDDGVRAGGITVTCDDGTVFSNGVEFVVNQMRPGFTYTATAVGLDGFDPVLAVLDEDGNGLCADDSVDTSNFAVNLPSSGRTTPSSFNPQIQFSQTAGQMADVSLVVGGFGDSQGEFVLLLEGMAATEADGFGDPFSVRLTPALTDSDVPLSVYMVSITSGLDPLLYLADESFNIATDEVGNSIFCDDGGNANLCWGENSSLAGSSLSRAGGRRDVPGGEFDAMLQIPLGQYGSLDFGDGPWYLTFVMTSFEQQTFGDYVIAFHAEAR